MNTIKGKTLATHMQSMYGAIIDNPCNTLVYLYTVGRPELPTHLTTPQGIKNCQPNCTVLEFEYEYDPQDRMYYLRVGIKEMVDKERFTRSSTVELKE